MKDAPLADGFGELLDRRLVELLARLKRIRTDSADLDLPLRIPGIPEATLSTGGNVVSGAAYANIAADMVDMETYAVLRACQGYKLPLIGLRGISDGAVELQHISGWTEYLHIVDRKLSYAVDSLFTALEDGVFWF